MTITTKSHSARPAPRPVASLDASLLLARKGEASPAIVATQHNNPGLAWGAAPHPEDFQSVPQPMQHQPAQVAPAQAQASHPPQPRAQARLRPDSLFARPRSTRSGAPTEAVTVALRLEDAMYLRLKYLAQASGMSTQAILNEALGLHLIRKGVPQSRKIVIKTE